MSSSRTTTRELGGSSNDEAYESPYFEEYDVNGDSYSLAWRYLGVYIDDDGYYTRKVLWAAYHDENYAGNEIGEYSFYDWKNQKWDNSTCEDVGDCESKMDCHDNDSSTWELVGVYKSSLGFDNDSFFEQLFKHQGYCLWTTSSDYKFMQKMRQMLDGSCQEVSDGVYVGPKPMKGGNLTQAVYTDAYCNEEDTSGSTTISDSVTSKYGSWNKAFSKWNSLMEAYKTCQPCRAYSMYSNTERRNLIDRATSLFTNSQTQRHLIEYNDGYGDEETNGFNCYDDAHYRNCNQCYKFDTKAGMEEADENDLQRASSQGTILNITVDGVNYGSRGYKASETDEFYDEEFYAASSMAVVAVMIAVAAVFATVLRRKRRIVVSADQLPLDHPVLQTQMD